MTSIHPFLCCLLFLFSKNILFEYKDNQVKRSFIRYTCNLHLENIIKMRNLFGVVLMLVLIGCDKSEGEGGISSISGNVTIQQWNNTFTVMSYEAEASDYDVFIVYGDELGYSDKTETDYNGDFKFSFLREGDYTVYVYSKVTSAEAINDQAPDEEAITQLVSLGKNDDLEIEDVTVLNN